MAPECEPRELLGRSSGSSELVIDSRTLDARVGPPPISNYHIDRSTDVHIGTKVVNVTQNVHKTDIVKELPLPRYLWALAQNTTRTERLACAGAILLLAAMGTVIAIAAIRSNRVDEQDVAPHEWNITRAMWLAREYINPPLQDRYEPVRLVVIHHSASTECHSFAHCAAELRNLQAYYIRDKDSDIPYNFIIGNDGRVYEGQGWDTQGAYLKGYNLCSLGIGFIGDYRAECEVHSTVTELQLNRTLMLLNWGVQHGSLHPRYLLSGAKDLRSSESPGSNLHNAIKQWPHYDHLHRFHNLTCDQIIATPL